MKKLILLSAIALLGFASCKKEVIEPGKPTTVEYVVVGQKLKITYNDESGLLFINTEVNGEYKHKFEAKTIQEAYISFRLEPNTESQSVLVQLKVNGFVINEFKHNHIKGADDVNGKFSVKIKKLTPEH